MSRLPTAHTYRLRKLGEAFVKGYSASVAITEVYDQDPPELRDLKDLIKPVMSEGIDLLKVGQMDAALSKLREAHSLLPLDLPLHLLINSLTRTLDQGEKQNRIALFDFR